MSGIAAAYADREVRVSGLLTRPTPVTLAPAGRGRHRRACRARPGHLGDAGTVVVSSAIRRATSN
ncbi:MAG: hypothetical protein R2719_08810 [Micropruina sp.]